MAKPVFVIAEAGVNHNGDLPLAKEMVRQAKHAGADAIKFQTFKAAKSVIRSAPKADYQVANTGQEESQFDMLKRLELSFQDHEKLFECCRDHGIEFLSSPFHAESVDLLMGLGLETIKIASSEVTNIPLLKYIAAKARRVLLSTGMANLGEIEQALTVLYDQGLSPNNVVLLHCNTEYPTPYEDVNLRAMAAMREAFQIEVGYSDHTPGIEVPIAAVALGATIIEKHFTLDRNMPGPDHKASLEPAELASMVRAIRHIEQAMGSGIKKPSPSEQKNMSMARKSIVAKRPIKKGDVLSEDNITTKRPGTGISAAYWEFVVGRVAGFDFAEDEMIRI